MAEITTLHATPRTAEGSATARRMRVEGKVPGVVYGLGGDPVNLTVQWRELRAALVTEQGLNAVIHLDIDGETTPTLVKEMQRHPVRRTVMHVDFIRVDLNKPVDVEVAISLEGEAEAVTRENGVVDQTMTSLLITAKPNDIPAGLTIDISSLEIGHALHVKDIVLPAGVTTHVDPEETVVTAQHAAVEVEEPVEGEEGAEGEGAEGEAAEGEATEAAEGAEGDAGGESGDAAAEGGDEG
jgi:large subunit ribosomal protein L25